MPFRSEPGRTTWVLKSRGVATTVITRLTSDFQDEAKIRILSAAESLYPQRSIESVSLRQIGRLAGHANTNAVQHQFIDRDGLVQAIFAWRVAQMERPHGQALAAAKRDRTARSAAEGWDAKLPLSFRQCWCQRLFEAVSGRSALLRQRGASRVDELVLIVCMVVSSSGAATVGCSHHHKARRHFGEATDRDTSSAMPIDSNAPIQLVVQRHTLKVTAM